MAPLEVYVQTLFVLLQTYLTFDRLARLGLQGVSACSRKARQRARRRLALRIRARRLAVVWAYPRAQHWWDVIVPTFTPMQFIQNFRVSRESFEYICHHLRHVLERRQNNYRLCVPVRKRVAIALWKLATGSEYRSVSHLFGVGLTTVFNCVTDFCNAINKVLLPIHIQFPDARKFVKMASFFEYHNVLVL